MTSTVGGPAAAAASQTATVSANEALAGESTLRPVLPTCWAFSLVSSHLEITCRLAQTVPTPLGPLQPSPPTPRQKKWKQGLCGRFGTLFAQGPHSAMAASNDFQSSSI